MPRTALLALLAMFVACGHDERRPELTAPRRLALNATIGTAESCLLDVNECPPENWIFEPAEMDPAVTQADSNCDFEMFGLAPTIPQWNLHPAAACLQRHWGQSGIYRQQARDIHVTSLPNRCHGPGDIDEIRLCSLAWINKPTPYGLAGGAGCIVVKLEVTCGV